MTGEARPVAVEIRISGTDADRAAVLTAIATVLEFDEPGRPRRNHRDPGARIYLRATAVRPAPVDQEDARGR